jgi:cellulose synthase/poly-beta-1,6-N-acetylglucosamine synthase-like glycosyltransferase/EAL domain-containing protein (putative c-di-GMP-specific phosphodiesterase class I)
MGRVAVIATLIVWLIYTGSWIVGQFFNGGATSNRAKVEAVTYLLVVTLLTASSLAYLMARLGYMYRVRQHQRVPRAVLDDYFAHHLPTLTVIVPSYQEEPRVIRNTLLSAALQEYPLLRVVLLVDNPPHPRRQADRRLLTAARSAARDVEELLRGPAETFAKALEDFEHSPRAHLPAEADMRHLASLFYDAADVVTSWQEPSYHDDPADRFFDLNVLGALAEDLVTTSLALTRAADEGVVLPAERLHQFYRRLSWTFRANVSSFERKIYANLSHEPNKAMNLNSYIGLMGGSYQDVETVAGRVLIPSGTGRRSIDIPNTDYVVTLDADSVILPEYCLRLVYLMEQAQNADVAVAQCPYSAFPGSSSTLERIAGATTDIQHIAHQGMTYYNATFWVGANAVLRKRALDDVVETAYVGDWPIHRYISDRTVIEDTESTLDLAERGWRLVNYPEHLAYSATPPDFGSLAIQRRRWANGGLIILPKLRRMARQRRELGKKTRFSEQLIRANYLASIAWSTTALILLLVYPFNASLLQPILIALPLPYFAAMASDLRTLGYRRRDLARTYGFNLLLIPINLAGVGTSIVQAILSDKSAFGRTPKVRERTIPALSFIVAPYVIDVVAGYTLWRDVHEHHWVNGVFAAVNVTLLTYAIVAFIGLRFTVVDLVRHVQLRLYKPVTLPSPTPVSPVERARADWATILHLGSSATSDEFSAAARGVGTVTAREDGPADVLFQSIWDLHERRIIGYEALSRFLDGGAPHFRIAEASSEGRGVEFEILLARLALERARELPAESYLALNASPAFATSGALSTLLEGWSRPVVLEINSRDLHGRKLDPRFPPGVQWAITDVVPGPETHDLLRHYRPEQIKVDMRWLTSASVEEESSTFRALQRLCASMHITLVVQHIEISRDLQLVEHLDVRVGQGYLLGRPRALQSSVFPPF